MEIPKPSPMQCPRCGATVPASRHDYPWHECGWNLPADPLDRMRGLRRLGERFRRAVGRWQARRDLAWMSREDPPRRLGWRLLSGFIVVLGIVLAVLPHSLFVGGAVLAYLAWRFNPCLAIPLLLVLAAVAIRWNPLQVVLPGRHRPAEVFPPFSLIEAVREVASDLGVAPPDGIAFNPWPVLYVDVRLRWSLPPRMERHLVVGLPVLAITNVSEFKSLVGEALVAAAGPRIWMYHTIARLWRWFSGLLQPVSDFLVNVISWIAPGVLFSLLCMVGAVTILAGADLEGRAQWIVQAFAAMFTIVRVLGIPVLSLVVVWVVAILLLWLVALWHRRQELLTDRAVARVYGRNAILRALPRLWAVRRVVGKRFYTMTHWARRDPERASPYLLFQTIWNDCSPVYQERILYEVTIGYPVPLAFVPLFSERVALLSDFPERSLNDWPASSLFPAIADLAAQMSRSL